MDARALAMALALVGGKDKGRLLSALPIGLQSLAQLADKVSPSSPPPPRSPLPLDPQSPPLQLDLQSLAQLADKVSPSSPPPPRSPTSHPPFLVESIQLYDSAVALSCTTQL